jgi:hypothetical protein
MGPHIEGNIIEIVLTIVGISFWILFPIGMFLSVSHVDKNTDQVVRLEHLRHDSVDEQVVTRPVKGPVLSDHFDWHHPIINFRRWLHQ